MEPHSASEPNNEAPEGSAIREKIKGKPVIEPTNMIKPRKSKISEKYIRRLAVTVPLSGILLAVLYSLTAWSSTILDASNNVVPNRDAWKYVVHALVVFVLISGASFFIGALLGFLFGFPRTTDSDEGDPAVKLRYQHNKNLEQISDWVIKMLIGIGLSQMREFPSALWYYASRLTEGVSTIGSIKVNGIYTSPAPASCLILFFLICGFIEGYLATRLLLPSKLVEVDKIST